MSDTIFRVVQVFVVFAALPVLAGRPLLTEDAAILDEKRCQLDAWGDHGREARVAWLAPACNIGAGIEWQAGFARERKEGDYRHVEAYAQGKALLRTVRVDSPWGVGVIAGVTRRRHSESRGGWRSPYVQIPVSFDLGNLLVHVQPGWTRDADARRDFALWGVAAEYPASERLTLLAEAFGQERERPWSRAGLRWTAINDTLHLSLTYVARIDGRPAERYANAGFTWQSPPFLP